MDRYAFCFEHKVITKENSVSTIKEYFVPYRPETLLKVVSSSILKQKLKRAIGRYENFDDCVKSLGLQNQDYIVKIPNNDNNEKSYWVNDNKNMEELSMWDYLADAKTIVETENAGRDFTERLNRLAEVTLISRMKFDHLKLIISILVYTYDIDHEPTSNNNGPRSKSDNEFIERLLDLYRELNRPEQMSLDQIIPLAQAASTHFDSLDHFKINKKTAFLMIEFRKVLEDLKFSNYGSRVNFYDHKIRLKEVIIRLINSNEQHYSKKYKYTKKYISLINELESAKAMFSTMPVSDEGIFNMCFIDDSGFVGLPSVLDHIVRYELEEESIINETVQLETFEGLAKSFKADLKTILKGEVKDYLLKRYGANDSGCFVILITHSGKKVFSLSGALELDKASVIHLEALVKYIMETILMDGTTVNDVYAQVYDYNWSALNGNTVRYTEVLEKNEEDPGKYIATPEVLSHDYNLSTPLTEIDLSKVRMTYICCERKILGSLGAETVSEIYSRWAPCWKCRPAIVASMPCSFYAFAKDFKDWKAKNKEMDLRKYSVIQRYVFDVE